MERPGSGGAEGAWAALLGRQHQQPPRSGPGAQQRCRGPSRLRAPPVTVPLPPAGPGVLPGGEQPALRVRDRALLRRDRLLHLLLRAVVVLAALDHPHPLQLLLCLPAPPGQAAPAAAAAAAGDQPHRLPRCLQLPHLHDGSQDAGFLQAACLRGGGPPAQHAAAALQRHPGPAEWAAQPPGLQQPHALAQLGELHQLLLRVELRDVPQQHLAVGAGDGRDGAQPGQHAQRGGRHQQHRHRRQLGAARGAARPHGPAQARPLLLQRGLLRGRLPPLLGHRGRRGGGGWRGPAGGGRRALPAPAPDGRLGHRGGALPGGGGRRGERGRGRAPAGQGRPRAAPGPAQRPGRGGRRGAGCSHPARLRGPARPCRLSRRAAATIPLPAGPARCRPRLSPPPRLAPPLPALEQPGWGHHGAETAPAQRAPGAAGPPSPASAPRCGPAGSAAIPGLWTLAAEPPGWPRHGAAVPPAVPSELLPGSRAPVGGGGSVPPQPAGLCAGPE